MSSVIFKKIKKKIAFRTKVFLKISLLFNLFYALFLFIIGWLYLSKWFLVMSAYYGLLALTRFFVFLQISPQKSVVTKLKTMRACGGFLLLINLVVATMMFILINEKQQIPRHEITVITLAAYTFLSLTVAIVHCVKYFKKSDYIYSCIKFLSLTVASASLVTLTNTMLSTWGEPNTLLRSIILPLLSFFVSVFIVNCAIFMIRKANLQLRIFEYEKERK